MGEQDAAAPRVSAKPVDPRLLRYASASRGFFALSAALTLVQAAVIVGFAWTLTTALVGALEGAPVADLVPLVAAGLGLVVVRAALVAASDRVSAHAAARSSLQLRAALVAAIGRLGPGWLAQRNAASLAVTAGHGLEALDAYFGRYLPQLVATVIVTPVLLVAILVADPVSALVVVVTMPLIPIFMVLIGLATRAVQRRQYGTLHRLAARFADTVGGLGTLKAFGRQHRAADAIEKVTRDYKRETMSVLRVSFVSGFALEFLASLSVAVIAVTIGLRLLSGELTLAIGLFVLLLAPEAYLPLRQVGVQFHAAAEGVAATDDVFSVLDAARRLTPAGTPTPVGSSSATAALSRDRGTSMRRTRTFLPHSEAGDTSGVVERAQRDETTTPLLETRALRVRRGDDLLPAVDLAVHAGEIVLLEGPSGAGKSSVLAALLGFAECEGEVLVEGMTDASPRGILSWSDQRAALMSGTVLDNVALGDPSPDADLARACLAAAQADDVDLATTLGALGWGLSGGQAQRVAVARALYRLRSGRARVLALDEPSSALDAATEARLWRALRAEADAGAGVLLVSHRTSARAIADRIVVLDRAEVIS
ncbi:thiol reductant ABC exporter subunit CydD [Microbacterium sp. BWT-B31]|uniref:thiol reductant ABC exporter subunit CydD n=1 Tax=Microbacterium sp. BWT-B31 TaxID=3232072 RepID=UPI00352704D8